MSKGILRRKVIGSFGCNIECGVHLVLDRRGRSLVMLRMIEVKDQMERVLMQLPPSLPMRSSSPSQLTKR